MKQSAVALALGNLLCASAQAAPTFELAMENILEFHGVANSTGSGTLTTRDIFTA